MKPTTNADRSPDQENPGDKGMTRRDALKAGVKGLALVFGAAALQACAPKDRPKGYQPLSPEGCGGGPEGCGSGPEGCGGGGGPEGCSGGPEACSGGPEGCSGGPEACGAM